jgi:CelD/BcsL family acetyltransferase involved in cellulose biosynthesis
VSIQETVLERRDDQKPCAPAGLDQRGAGRRRRRDGAQLSVALLASWSAVEDVRTEWEELYRGTRSRNPFASPEWVVVWGRHFVAERDLAVLAVRRNGRLIGLAPWYRRRVAGLARSLQVLGSGQHDALTELPQVLTADGEYRSVLRAVVDFWSRRVRAWDWMELPLLGEQGWFEPDWLTGDVGAQSIIQHKTTRAAVVFTVPEGCFRLDGMFKRNLTESVRRGRNRLNRTGRAWRIASHTSEADVERALPVLAELHARRAALGGRKHHPDELADPSRMAFLRDVLPRMARWGQAEILTLDVEGRSVAAQLVLQAPDGTFLAMSGVDPEWWQFSPVTLLQMRAVETAVERGHTEVNLAIGPSVAKLRWSERVDQHPEFVVCGPRLRSKALFVAFRVAAALAAVRREARRHTVTKPTPA